MNLEIKTIETTDAITVEAVMCMIFVGRWFGRIKYNMTEPNVINNKNEATE